MIEVVFNESSEGSLKVAQSYGKGKISWRRDFRLYKKAGCLEIAEEAPAGEVVYRRRLKETILTGRKNRWQNWSRRYKGIFKRY